MSWEEAMRIALMLFRRHRRRTYVYGYWFEDPAGLLPSRWIYKVKFAEWREDK